MDLLNNIIKQIEESDWKWTDIAKEIGIEEIDITEIQKKNDSVTEFVYTVTKKIWNDIFQFLDIASKHSEDGIAFISNLYKLGDILKHCNESENKNQDIEESGKKKEAQKVNGDGHLLQVEEKPIQKFVIDEIANRLSEWKIFGRVLGLEETFLNQLDGDYKTCNLRNYEIMNRFCKPAKLNTSWCFWRQYLNQFNDGKLVIREIEMLHPDLLSEVSNTGAHMVIDAKQCYIGHPFQKSDFLFSSINFKTTTVAVRVGSKDFQCEDHQSFTKWVETQQRYIDIFNMLKDLKAINFSNIMEKCLILDTLKRYLEIEQDPGFIVKGYHLVDHINLFDPGKFARNTFDDHYICFLVKQNVALYITKSDEGPGHALFHAMQNIHLFNLLHKGIQSDKITQINVIMSKNGQSSIFCKQCINGNLYVPEKTFSSLQLFSAWYKEILSKYNSKRKLAKLEKKHQIYKTIKKEIITFEALENLVFPSFSYCFEDQMDELKKLVLLTHSQYLVLHCNNFFIILRGSYGCGKSLVLLRKLETVITKMLATDIIYLICNDQQSEYVHFLKFVQSKYPGAFIVVCKSNDICTGSNLPKLSVILEHIHNAWKGRTVHIFIDEFNGSYIDITEVVALQTILSKFENSHIVIALQSMEEHVVKSANISSTPDLGYQLDLLVEKTPFCVYNLDYSLRCSVEINQFVKATAEIIESCTTAKMDIENYRVLGKIVDKEHGREKNLQDTGYLSTKFSYNQNIENGHAVSCAPVYIYLIERSKAEVRIKSGIYIAVLTYILIGLEDLNDKGVICTYDEELYNAVYHFLKQQSYKWTNSIKDFIKADSSFDILLTEYAGIRGYEFPNVIFLLPLGTKFLKYRMIECFTRATTKLYIVVDDFLSVYFTGLEKLFQKKKSKSSNSIDDQLISKWKGLSCVKLYTSKYEKSTDVLKVLYNGDIIYAKASISSFVIPKGNKYPWSDQPHKIEEQVPNHKNDLLIGMQCVIGADNVSLLNEYLETNLINLNTYHDEEGNNLLHIAAMQNSVNILVFLTENHRFDVNCLNYFKVTPLHFSSYHGHIEFVKILLDKHADVYVKDNNGYTPLHKATFNGHTNIIELLLLRKADMHAKDHFGNLPIHFAARDGNKDIVELLLKHEVLFDLKNSIGLTPNDYAVRNGHEEISRILKSVPY